MSSSWAAAPFFGCAMTKLLRRQAWKRGQARQRLSVALAAMSLIVDPRFEAGGGAIYGGILIVLMILVALYRRRAIALLHAAGAATVLICLRAALSGTFLLELPLGTFMLDGLPEWMSAEAFRPVGIGLALAFLAAGFWRSMGRVAETPKLAAEWAAWATLVPLAVLVSQWIATFGNLDRDFAYAAAALASCCGPDSGGRGHGTPRGTGPDGWAGRIVCAGRRCSGDCPDAPYGLWSVLDDHPRWRGGRYSGTCNPCAQLPDSGLAVRGCSRSRSCKGRH